jgi:hypothetical protein
MSPPSAIVTWPAAAQGIACFHCWKTARWVRTTITSPSSTGPVIGKPK